MAGRCRRPFVPGWAPVRVTARGLGAAAWRIAWVPGVLRFAGAAW